MKEQLWTDGGLIGRNPSKVGGTWAWVHVSRVALIPFEVRRNSGITSPELYDDNAVSNNHAELLAAVIGLEEMGSKWSGEWWTDSKVTLARLTGGGCFDSVPRWLRDRARAVERGRRWTAHLCAGHPTRAELAAGKAKRNGLPVSPWNQLCDRLCTEAGRAHLAKLGLQRKGQIG